MNHFGAYVEFGLRIPHYLSGHSLVDRSRRTRHTEIMRPVHPYCPVVRILEVILVCAFAEFNVATRGLIFVNSAIPVVDI